MECDADIIFLVVFNLASLFDRSNESRMLSFCGRLLIIPNEEPPPRQGWMVEQSAS